MPEALKYLFDAAAGAALFMALIVVFLVDWLFFAGGPGVVKNTLENVKVIEDTKQRERKKLRLAVTPSDKFPPRFPATEPDWWDDMGKLLTQLGDGYRYDKITTDKILADPKILREYDVLFLTCHAGGEDLNDILRAFVKDGGILYASDWRYNAVAAAFPEMVDEHKRGEGVKYPRERPLEADIVDPGLRELLGTRKVHLAFDLDQWKTAAFGGPRVEKLIEGTYRKYLTKGELATAPLMVRFKVDKGTVIFTSFHNEKQNSEVETKLLQYLVFSLITAGIDADMNTKMEGFAPQRSNLLSTPSRNQSVSKTYDNAKRCTLRFALGFHNVGAKLRFNIKSPDGKEFTQDCVSTVILEVADAAPGTWTYTVTTLEVPYKNLPFKTFVTEKN